MFKVGDRVRIVRPGSAYRGDCGIVVETSFEPPNPWGLAYAVDLAEKYPLRFSEDELVHASGSIF